MPINVSQAIDSQTGERIRVHRQMVGRYVDGLYVEGKTKVIKAMASQQVVTPEMMVGLEGTERTRDIKVFFVNKRVYSSNEITKEPADIIEWQGKYYRVMKVGDWSSYGYNYALGALIDED